MNTINQDFWPLETEKQLRMLYEKYSKLFYSKAHKILKQESASEEVVQDVFIAVWQNRGDIQENALNIEAYLNGILRNKIFDSLRKIIKNKVIDYVNEDQMQDSTNDWYDAKELKIFLEIILSKMPKMQRVVFEMIRFDGLKREEVAKQLNISPNTVKNHLLAASKFLKENLDSALIIYLYLHFSEKF